MSSARINRLDLLKAAGVGALGVGGFAAAAGAKPPPWSHKGASTSTSTATTTTAPPPTTTTATTTTTGTSSGAIDDKRAIHMSALSSTGAVVNPDGSPNGLPDSVIVRSQTPPGFWTSLIYTNDDVSLIPDARYGQVYRFRTNGNSRNPYWSTAITCATEFEWDRRLTIGQTDWYAFATKHEPTWDYANTVDWHSLFQCCYPTISSAPITVMAGYGDNIFLQRVAGLVTNGRAAENDDYGVQGSSIAPFLKQSAIEGHWLEHLLGIKWGSHADGEIHYATRCKDLGESSFIDRINLAGVTTWQWGTSDDGLGNILTVPQDPQNLMVNDKLDSYYGYKPGLTDADIPTNYLQHTGHVRCASKAEALSYL